MHIAICIEQAAARKHLERQLGREETFFRTSEPLYIDSYGTTAALFAQPLQYDIYLCEAESAHTLLSAVYILRAIKDNYPNAQRAIFLPTDLTDSFFDAAGDTGKSVMILPLPLSHNTISGMISKMIEQKKQAEPVFEIRGRNQTVYLHAEEFMYGKEHGKRQAIVKCSDGRTLDFLDSLSNLAETMSEHPDIFLLGTHHLINTNYIKRCHLFSINMLDNSTIPASFLETYVIRKQLKQLMSDRLHKSIP